MSQPTIKNAIKIQARNVGMDFAIADERGRKQQISALQDFNLDIRNGEFFTILGPSGCGKSTFLNVLAGLARKTSGSIHIDGQEASGINREQGVVFQGYALFPWRTVLENIEVGLEIRKVAKRERRETAEHFVNLVGLDGFGHRYPHELSGGMRQRVAIARSLAYSPSLLLMDEPFAALDAQTREILQSELLRIWEQQKTTIVFITHSLDEAIFLSDRIAVMTHRPGRIKATLDIPLARPRPAEVRHSAAFVQLREKTWEVLRDEVAFASGHHQQPLAPLLPTAPDFNLALRGFAI
ncbi:ABC transporter ATP-binding protein [Comamonas sp. Y33R10-2]|uniref:ABC transporter ATP-binding protein n=1 Tax=Comamonas sp. Y33R10-2 TaxID=2853257 RepID=UPI001C5CBE34|nr:ABC transporter ATP-binding protein [Comamonas sp. Y33R10-2]QXZ08589.1 ABC transporter ATP-binding protein [Comamonas sp. Y33R10-2]